AWITYLFQRKIRQAERRTGYRAMYTEFWKDEDNASVRNWVTNDVEYERVRDILERRLKSTNNTLSIEDNKVLERIDRFCAFLIRVQYFEKPAMTRKERRLWDRAYSDYWMGRIRARKELWAYIEEYWYGVKLEPLEEQTRRRTMQRRLKRLRE